MRQSDPMFGSLSPRGTTTHTALPRRLRALAVVAFAGACSTEPAPVVEQDQAGLQAGFFDGRGFDGQPDVPELKGPPRGTDWAGSDVELDAPDIPATPAIRAGSYDQTILSVSEIHAERSDLHAGERTTVDITADGDAYYLYDVAMMTFVGPNVNGVGYETTSDPDYDCQTEWAVAVFGTVDGAGVLVLDVDELIEVSGTECEDAIAGPARLETNHFTVRLTPLD